MLYAKQLWCEEFRKVVQQQLDGEEISAGITRGVQEHREACPSCCDFHDQLVQVAAVSGHLLPPAEYETSDEVELWKKIIKDVTK